MAHPLCYRTRPSPRCMIQLNHISSRAYAEARFLSYSPTCRIENSPHSSQSLSHGQPSATQPTRLRSDTTCYHRVPSSPSIMRPSCSYSKNTRFVTPSKSTSRAYHSDHHAPASPTHEYTNSQTTILTAALKHVPTHGFTKEALTLGARDSGFLDVSVQLLTRQEMDLILFWLASRRGLLRAQVEAGLFSKQQQQQQQKQEGIGHSATNRELSVEDKVRTLVMERLRMNESVIHRWQDALAVMSFPTNIPLALSELHALSSDILYLAGDTTVDASWYTKRLSLATIYASAEVIMTQDQSSDPKFAATEAFVDRRIHDNHAIGEGVASAKQYLGFLASSAVGLGRSWGMKI